MVTYGYLVVDTALNGFTKIYTTMKNNITKYGFQAHLSPEFPSQIIVDVIEFCNLACVHCPHEEFTKSEAFSGRHLNTGLHKKLINEVAEESKGHCKYLRYTGQGEPLLHPNFVEMIEYASKHSGVSINVTTNGMLLTEKRAKALLEARVDVFDVSIDANTSETYAAIRKKGDLSIIRQNVLRLIELIKKGEYKTRLVVSFVEQPLNKHESADFKRYWDEAGADYVVIRRLHSCAGLKRKVAEFMLNQIKRDRRPCLYPWERLVLSPTGQVGFCPDDWKYRSKIAYLKDITIREIWQGEFMKGLRDAHLQKDFSNYSFCGQCPDWSITRWPNEDRAYYDVMKELVSFDLVNIEK